ncbi:peptidoglycan amidohydrolase family protein [Enterococcus sp. LJL128]|uniref:peptidoglycan amidohydrolase family protein n=1 Tax=Enterococcus sp. LJL51 TaxID=3416656 RepID=UPI003CF7DE77
MTSKEQMIRWMADRQGKVTYSMNARTGPASYDCSSAVYYALQAGEFLHAGTMGNTDSLFGHLENNGWKALSERNGYIDAGRGDIFIWGVRGASGGASGHTGIFLDTEKIIHCNYGYNGITVNNHDQIWTYNGGPANTIYRYQGTENNSSSASKEFSVGQQVKLLNHATQYQTRERIPVWVKNRTYTIQQEKKVTQSNSKKAYLLKEIQSWVLEQDLG